MTGLRVKLADMFDAPRVSRELARSFGGRYWLRDWTKYHANFFRALKIERTVMFVILTLIVAVAAFNLVSTLIMVVTDKEADIAILRTLGASQSSILSIFVVQGTVIGVAGTLVGIAGGVALATNVETLVPAIESLFDVQFLSRAGLLHQRGSVGDALARRRRGGQRRIRDVGARDALPGVEGLSSPAGGGTAP